jgi:hypothetical protein
MKKFKVKAILRQSLRNQKALSKTYSERIEVFSKWAESKGYKRGTMDDVNRLIPEYLREREDKGLSAATLHTDLAALCKAVERPMSDFKTYYRGQPTKGRDDTVKRVRTARNERVVHLAERIGIRKSEYEHLHKND